MRRVALLWLFFPTLAAFAGDAFQLGSVELYPTPAAIGLDVAYQGDDNQNGSASFVWRRKGESSWRNGVDLTVDRKLRRLWGSIWPLAQGDEVEVRISFSDPDGAPKDHEASITVRKLILEPQAGRTVHVSPSGADDNPGTSEKPLTLRRAVVQARAGDVILLQEGTYPEGDLGQRLRGTASNPIVFRAAPGARPVLDSSLTIALGKGAWKDEGGGVFSHPIEASSPVGYVAQDGLRMFRFRSLTELRSSKVQIPRGFFHDARAGRLHVRTGSRSSPDAHRYSVARHEYAFHLTGSRHVVLQGLTMQNYGNVAVRLSEGASGCIVIDNVIRNCSGGIFLKGETTSDNALWKNEIVEPGLNDFPWALIKNSDQGRQGIFAVAGRGTSICHNRIAGWFDCICPESWKNPDKLSLNRDCDVMFNELSDAGDDAIEADGGGVNMRIHANRIRQCHSALSLAPIERGPVYVTRNDATFFNLMFKLNVAGCTSNGWTYCYHNSGYCLTTGPDGGTGISFPPTIPCTNKVFLNNAILCNEWSVRAGRAGCRLDHNCYFHVPGKPARKFQWEKQSFPTIVAFRKGTGQEKNGLYDDPRFEASPDLGRYASPDSQTVGLSSLKLPQERPGNLTLKPNSPCIDRGALIRGVNEDHRGKAPDIGAFER